MSRGGIIRLAIVLGVVGVVGWFAYGRLYGMPRAKLLDEIATLEEQNSSLEGAVAQIPDLRRRLREAARGALGGTPDQADHTLRTALAAVAGRVGLQGVSVVTDRPQARANPYTKARRTSSSLRRLLRDQRDFAVIGARVDGQGTLEQTMRLIAALQSQAWVARLTSFTIKPIGEARERFEITLRTQSLYVPDLVEEAHVEVVDPDPLLLAQIEPVVMKNVFRYDPPEPEAPAQVVVKAPPPPPPAPAWGEWKLTGIVQAREGVEAWVRNLRTGQWLTLRAGQSVLDARLLDAKGERAVFEIDGRQYEVFAGQTLAQRREIPQVQTAGG